MNSSIEQSFSFSDKNESALSHDSQYDSMHCQNHQYHGQVKRESSHRYHTDQT